MAIFFDEFFGENIFKIEVSNFRREILVSPFSLQAGSAAGNLPHPQRHLQRPRLAGHHHRQLHHLLAGLLLRQDLRQVPPLPPGPVFIQFLSTTSMEVILCSILSVPTYLLR
jgi:hypothetical protein